MHQALERREVRKGREGKREAKKLQTGGGDATCGESLYKISYKTTKEPMERKGGEETTRLLSSNTIDN